MDRAIYKPLFLSSLVVLAITMCVGIWFFGRNSCENYVSTRFEEDYLSVLGTYKFLHWYDDHSCGRLSPPEFDNFVGRNKVNLVSFVLFYSRFGEGTDEDVDKIIDEYVDVYVKEKGNIDSDMLMILIDIAYYPCRGNESCVGKKIEKWSRRLSFSRDAECLYGMSGQCAPDQAASITLLNGASLKLQKDPDGAALTRKLFACSRYADCSR